MRIQLNGSSKVGPWSFFPQNEAEKPRKVRRFLGWWGMVAICSVVALVVAVLGAGLGSYASVENIIQQIHQFGLFDKCYQC